MYNHKFLCVTFLYVRHPCSIIFLCDLSPLWSHLIFHRQGAGEFDFWDIWRIFCVTFHIFCVLSRYCRMFDGYSLSHFFCVTCPPSEATSSFTGQVSKSSTSEIFVSKIYQENCNLDVSWYSSKKIFCVWWTHWPNLSLSLWECIANVLSSTHVLLPLVWRSHDERCQSLTSSRAVCQSRWKDRANEVW